MERDVVTEVGRLDLAQKCALVAGASVWRTPALPDAGVPAIKMTDGPNGARGEHGANSGSGVAGVAVPVGIAQGATWDPALVEEIGELLGREARRRGAHVLLAPAVNLHRTPVGGRTFEYFSEDPELTASLATAAVRGIQRNGVAATVKHFVANDTEVDRMTVDVRVGERVLRELYLRPFEDCVRLGGTWAVMSAYNRLDGEHCAAHHRLLVEVLREEWGFDGAVVSDWFGAHDTVGSVHGGLSIEMPGPARIYGPHLVDAVRAGRVDEGALDERVADVLRLAARTDAAGRSADEPETSVDDPAERALCRRAAVAGTVLARNEAAALPLDATAGLRVAVLGPNAEGTRIQGGGSSGLRALPHRSVLAALRDRLGDVAHEPGVTMDKHVPVPRLAQLVGPDGSAGGLAVRFHRGTDPDGDVLHETRNGGLLQFFGSLPEGVELPCRIEVRGAYVPTVDGTHEAGLIASGRPGASIGGAVLARDGEALPGGEAFYGLGSEEQVAPFEGRAGEPVPVALDLEVRHPFAALRLGVRPPVDDQMFARAVDAAAEADVAVVVVGTNDEWETEGTDRTTIALPGEQDALIAAVAAACPRTVVVVNAGSPVSMPWLDDVGAVVLPFFGGMEMGDAVADVLLGVADPGGRLPTSFPHRLEDAPAWPHYAPVDGVQRYGEGLLVGYRGHDASGVAPMLAFGHGLSYGSATWGEATASTATVAAGGGLTVTVPVSADGGRDATVVVQVYVAPVNPPVEREPKALKGWRKVVVPAGTTVDVQVALDERAFRRWDDVEHRWTVDPGAYDLVVAASAVDVRSTVRIEVTA